MNHRQPEQLNNAQFPAESEPEYTLEEIMAEFGAPQEPEPIPEPIPEPVPEPEPIPEPEPVQPEPQQTSPPEPQPERVHVFRPVPDRRPPRPERAGNRLEGEILPSPRRNSAFAGEAGLAACLLSQERLEF